MTYGLQRLRALPRPSGGHEASELLSAGWGDFLGGVQPGGLLCLPSAAVWPRGGLVTQPGSHPPGLAPSWADGGGLQGPGPTLCRPQTGPGSRAEEGRSQRAGKNRGLREVRCLGREAQRPGDSRASMPRHVPRGLCVSQLGQQASCCYPGVWGRQGGGARPPEPGGPSGSARVCWSRTRGVLPVARTEHGGTSPSFFCASSCRQALAHTHHRSATRPRRRRAAVTPGSRTRSRPSLPRPLRTEPGGGLSHFPG